MATETTTTTDTTTSNTNPMPKWFEGSPWYVQLLPYLEKNYGKQGINILIVVAFCYQLGPWVTSHIVDPTICTYNQTIKETSQANLINAESNKQNSETQRATSEAIAQIRALDQTKMDKLAEIGTHLKSSSEEMRKVVGQLKETEESQANSLKIIADKLKNNSGG